MDYPKNFSRKEFLRSATAKKLNIENIPCECQEKNLIRLANWLQQLRDALCEHYGKKIILYIRSGFRSKHLNVAVLGSSTSAHLKGLAADITSPQLTSTELTQFVISYMEDYDQVIEEFGLWTHIGLSVDEPREEALRARRDGKRVLYSRF
ncbi:MAG: D-Ala-D-Ala carboxypeptidase family metallohydrolase [Vibrio splendidus]